MLKLKDLLKEDTDPRQVYLQTRKSRSVSDSAFPFYVIKDFLDVGYWDRVAESDFKKAYDKVMAFLLTPDSNAEKMAGQYKWMTDYDELWQYQQSKQD